MAILDPLWAKFYDLRPLLSITFPQEFWIYLIKIGHLVLGRGGKKTFKRGEQITNKKLFFCRSNFTPLLRKNVPIWDQFFPLLFPKDAEYLKCLDIWLWEVGAKRPLSRVNKWKKSVKKTFFDAAILHHLWTKKFTSETTKYIP